MLSFEEAKKVLSLQERDHTLYMMCTVENFDYEQATDRTMEEELFIHSTTAFINQLVHDRTGDNEAAEAWSVVYAWLVEQERARYHPAGEEASVAPTLQKVATQ